MLDQKTISDKLGKDYFRISVKREAGPKADTPKGYVSNKLHDEFSEGNVIEVEPPCGEFFLNTNDKHKRPLVLLAAGVGITPILSILHTALEAMPNRQIVFVHGCLNEEAQAFKNVIDQLAEEHANLTVHYRYSDPSAGGATRGGNASTGFVTAELIESLTPDRHADYYFCGPKPFMVNIYHELLKWGVPGSQVHFEFFGPKNELENLE